MFMIYSSHVLSLVRIRVGAIAELLYLVSTGYVDHSTLDCTSLETVSTGLELSIYVIPVLREMQFRLGALDLVPTLSSSCEGSQNCDQIFEIAVVTMGSLKQAQEKHSQKNTLQYFISSHKMSMLN